MADKVKTPTIYYRVFQISSDGLLKAPTYREPYAYYDDDLCESYETKEAAIERLVELNLSGDYIIQEMVNVPWQKDY